MSEATISKVDAPTLLALFGPGDQHLRALRTALGVTITARDDQILIRGDAAPVAKAADVLEQFKALVQRHGELSAEDVQRTLATLNNGGAVRKAVAIDVFAASRKIVPRTLGQERYIDSIRAHDIVFCCGPAGTGKTYLAVAMAVAALKQELIRKIVLVRPAVEAGESLGYLPGDLEAKINPYLRPLKDALREMMDHDQIKRFGEQEIIEVVPLAYMRGRTLNEAFMILDEAQNTSVAQMKMFLTRMGHGSKIVISGDTTQIDLPSHQRSGLIDAVERLRGIQGIAQVQLSDADIVRHRLVQDIVRAYDDGPQRRR
ncbi:MAG: PhoH family protein [Planctomycetia bacterium]|nr:PhoH family protein [Planctomycetia bacterium]